MKKLSALTLGLAIALASVPTQAQFPSLPGGLGKKVDKATGFDKCADDDETCKLKAKGKEAAGAVAIGLAAKLIADMVIESRALQVNDEGAVVNEYKKEFKTLPAEPTARQYAVNADPGNVVKPATTVKIKSQITVIPSAASKEVMVEEKMTIFDNEDNTKPLRESTKLVNEKTKRGGRFTNEFGFTFPDGLPQGVYPIGNELFLNGKSVQSSKTEMQLVLVVDGSGIRVAAAH